MWKGHKSLASRMSLSNTHLKMTRVTYSQKVTSMARKTIMTTTLVSSHSTGTQDYPSPLTSTNERKYWNKTPQRLSLSQHPNTCRHLVPLATLDWSRTSIKVSLWLQASSWCNKLCKNPWEIALILKTHQKILLINLKNRLSKTHLTKNLKIKKIEK